eukprot:jgi/Hompol1/5230/HPOL_004312-RA
MAITGNPGIGKSLFLFYIMWRISTMDGVGIVVLRRAKDYGLIYVFEKTRCWTTSKYDDVVDWLFLPDTWYLTDTLATPPGEFKAVTIVVASPARVHYKEFLKYSSTDSLRYLPVWSLDELKQAAALYDIEPGSIEQRYCLIGGIARYVLEKQKEDLSSTIAVSVGRLNIDKFLLIADGKLDKNDEISHLIVHYVVNCDFQMTSLQFSSTYVTEKALRLFSENQHQKLCELLLYNDPTSITSGLRGNLFGAFAHRLLSSGGEFDYRCLDDDIQGKLTLIKRDSDRFGDIAKCEGDKYFIAWNPNYPCIDAYIPKQYLFQMTVSDEHPVIKTKMLEILDSTKLKALHFVVPRKSFENFSM